MIDHWQCVFNARRMYAQRTHKPKTGGAKHNRTTKIRYSQRFVQRIPTRHSIRKRTRGDIPNTCYANDPELGQKAVVPFGSTCMCRGRLKVQGPQGVEAHVAIDLTDNYNTTTHTIAALGSPIHLVYDMRVRMHVSGNIYRRC